MILILKSNEKCVRLFQTKSFNSDTIPTSIKKVKVTLSVPLLSVIIILYVTVSRLNHLTDLNEFWYENSWKSGNKFEEKKQRKKFARLR